MQFLAQVVPLVQILIGLGIVTYSCIYHGRIFVIVANQFAGSDVVGILVGFMQGFQGFGVLLVIVILFPHVVVVFAKRPLGIQILVDGDGFLDERKFLFRISSVQTEVVQVGCNLFQVSLGTVDGQRTLEETLGNGKFTHEVVHYSTFVIASGHRGGIADGFEDGGCFVVQFNGFVVIA